MTSNKGVDEKIKRGEGQTSEATAPSGKDDAAMIYGMENGERLVGIGDKKFVPEEIDMNNPLLKIMSTFLDFCKAIKSCRDNQEHAKILVDILLDTFDEEGRLVVTDPDTLEAMRERGSANASLFTIEKAEEIIPKVTVFVRVAIGLSSTSTYIPFGIGMGNKENLSDLSFPPNTPEERTQFVDTARAVFVAFEKILKQSYFEDWDNFKECVKMLSGRFVVRVFNKSTKKIYKKKIAMEKAFKDGCLIVIAIGMAYFRLLQLNGQEKMSILLLKDYARPFSQICF